MDLTASRTQITFCASNDAPYGLTKDRRTVWEVYISASVRIAIGDDNPSRWMSHAHFERNTRAHLYFFINSSTAVVIALIPVRRVGSGSGSNKLECSEGSVLPDFLAASTRAGSTAPSQNMKAGI